MSFCMWVWTSMNAFWSWIYPIISSPTIIAAFLAPYFAISTYLKQQRISRIQRIYYEESLFDQLKHLDTLIDLTTENLSYFENAINLILNDFRVGVITAETILSLNKIANKINMPTRYHSSKREVLINLFKEHGYVLQQWLFKYDKDFSGFNLHIREVISGFATILQTHPNTPRSFITNHAQDMENDFNLIMRHYTFVYLFNRIVSRVGVLDFKSQKALVNNLKKDYIISPTLRKIDKAFKILFGYFQLEDKTFLSYLEDENRNRFKFDLNEQISIEIVKENPPPETQLRIIKNDTSLANLKIKVNNVESYYSQIQTGIANLCAFDEKPKFYREAESFDNFQ